MRPDRDAAHDDRARRKVGDDAHAREREVAVADLVAVVVGLVAEGARASVDPVRPEAGLEIVEAVAPDHGVVAPAPVKLVVEGAALEVVGGRGAPCHLDAG